jgi:hypothetical protein
MIVVVFYLLVVAHCSLLVAGCSWSMVHGSSVHGSLTTDMDRGFYTPARTLVRSCSRIIFADPNDVP